VAELGEHVDGFGVEVEQVAAGAEGVFQPDELPPAVELGDADQVELVAAVVEDGVDDRADGGAVEVGRAGRGLGPGHPLDGVEDFLGLGLLERCSPCGRRAGSRTAARRGCCRVIDAPPSAVRNDELPEEVQMLRTSPMPPSWGSARTTYSTPSLTWWIELIHPGLGWPLCCARTRSPT
jgi:hypothetical protein